MKTYEVRFEVDLPDEVTYEEADEFIQFNIGARGDMSMENPLADTDLMSQIVKHVSVS